MFIECLTGGPEAGQCGVSTVETYALLDHLEEMAQGCVCLRLSREEWPSDCTEQMEASSADSTASCMFTELEGEGCLEAASAA
jgi:hypothetical protein